MTLPEPFLTRPIAHRGLHDRAARRPENSRAAMRAAIEKGYGIEIDLQRSADGVPMVFHDSDLLRLTGVEGLLAERTAEALGRLRLYDGEEGIPTFAEVLALVDGRVPLLVEVKDQTHELGPVDGRLESAVAEAVRGYRGPLALMSFNPHAVIALRDLAPEVPRGITTCAYDPGDREWAPAGRERLDRQREIAHYDEAGASFISHEARDLSRPRVTELKAAGGTVLSWTIRSPEQEAEARRRSDNITFEGYLA